ncbi:MAG: hypothetical protein ABSB58_05425 [Gemmatimonadales bacterium]
MNRDDVVAWLVAREPAAPAGLAERLLGFAQAAPAERLGGTMTQAMSGLGLFALDGSVARGETGDEVALDLLAADAFVTYAFEAAAEEGADVRQAAADLITRMAP